MGNIGVFMGFGNLIFLILMIVFLVGMVIFIIASTTLSKSIFVKILLLLIGIIPITLGIISMVDWTDDLKKGSPVLYETTKEIGMEQVKQGYLTGTYKKNNLEIRYSEGKNLHKYIITDKGDINLSNHEQLLDAIISIEKKTIQMICNHLVYEAQLSGGLAKVVIEKNHFQLQIEYNLKNETITYTVIKLMSTNEDYDVMYEIPRLEISHYSILENSNKYDESVEFDNQLLHLLFYKDINSFNINYTSDDIIVYTSIN